MHASETADREIVATRVLDAPRDLVWKVWTDPQHIGQWWGPRGFTTTTRRMDFRPGGVWEHVMHGPDGTDYPNTVVYREIVEPERLVFDHVSDHALALRFHTTVTFTAEGNKTRLTYRIVFDTAESREATIKKHRADEGLQQMLDRFGELLTANTGAIQS